MNKKFKFHKFKVFLTAILLLGILTPTGTALADEYSAPSNYATTSFKATNNKNIWSEAALNSSKVASPYNTISRGSNSMGSFRGTGAGVGGAGLGILAFSPHSKNARKSTHDKHTKRRPGGNEKKKQSPKWQSRK